jgi:TonB-dependent SusC/RagA subfamily outer membrane receptor
MNKRVLLVIFLTTFFIFAYGQKKVEVTGHAFGPDNMPVMGAIVIVDGNSTGKKTDKNGNFKIKINPDSKVIGLSTPDNKFAEQPYEGKNDLHFSLSENFSATMNASSPNPEAGKLNNKKAPASPPKAGEKRIYKDIYEMLRSKPGLVVRGTKVTIQGGASTYSGSTDPLYIVDGVEVSSLDVVVPDNVSRIDVLKGTSAAMYGSRGANGVIVVTTKK